MRARGNFQNGSARAAYSTARRRSDIDSLADAHETRSHVVIAVVRRDEDGRRALGRRLFSHV